MLFRIILNYIIGYIRISIEGYYIERFINICRNKKILIWNLKRNKDVRLELNTQIKDFKKIIRISKKVGCKVKIQRKKGLPFLFNKYKKRKIFFGFLLILIALFIILSNFIWNIQIIQENKDELGELENITQDLKNCGLQVGKLKSKVNTKDIINKIRMNREDIAWVGIEIKGTNAIVKLVKATAKPEIADEDMFCNIVSDKEGIITRINAQNGTIAVKPGDIVKKGTTLINGWMEGKYTGLRYVHAKGNIEAKIWHTKQITIPYNTTEKRETGRKEKKISIKINNFTINFPKKLSKFEIYDTIEAENKIKIFSDFYLPISLKKITNIELEEIEKKYSFEEAKLLGIEELEKQFDEEIEDKEKIVNKIINTYDKDNEVEIIETYEVLENLGTEERIVF